MYTLSPVKHLREEQIGKEGKILFLSGEKLTELKGASAAEPAVWGVHWLPAQMEQGWPASLKDGHAISDSLKAPQSLMKELVTTLQG